MKSIQKWLKRPSITKSADEPESEDDRLSATDSAFGNEDLLTRIGGKTPLITRLYLCASIRVGSTDSSFHPRYSNPILCYSSGFEAMECSIIGRRRLAHSVSPHMAI